MSNTRRSSRAQEEIAAQLKIGEEEGTGGGGSSTSNGGNKNAVVALTPKEANAAATNPTSSSSSPPVSSPLDASATGSASTIVPAPMPAPVEVEDLSAVLETFDYDVLAYGHDPGFSGDPTAAKRAVFPHIKWMLGAAGCLGEFSVPPAVVDAFMGAVAGRYADENPYHNFWHGVDVMQTLFMFVRANDGEAILSPVDIFAVLVGGLAHDLQHPGVSAAFLMNTRHDLALTYNDTSVLENMHVSTLYRDVLADAACDVFGTLSAGEWKAARQVIIKSVIATDMSHHFTMVSELELFHDLHEQQLHRGGEVARAALFEDTKKRQALLDAWMHSADISNPVKNFAVCEKWAGVVMREFFAQGDREKALSLPVSPGFDRDTTSTPGMQVNFIEFVVGPLYAKLIRICPHLMELGVQIVHNRKQWGDQLLMEMMAGADGHGLRGAAEQKEYAAKRDKELMRRAKFEQTFAFVFDRQRELRETDPGWAARTPGARGLDFTGSLGPGHDDGTKKAATPVSAPAAPSLAR